jgi:hypothetical protein
VICSFTFLTEGPQFYKVTSYKILSPRRFGARNFGVPLSRYVYDIGVDIQYGLLLFSKKYESELFQFRLVQ